MSYLVLLLGTATKLHLNHRQSSVMSTTRRIRDAMKGTINLGFTYLWANALGIIQDSNQSKLRKLSVMHQIYENSSLTIVAASIASADHGSLEVRTVSKTQDLQNPIPPQPRPILYNQRTRA